MVVHHQLKAALIHRSRSERNVRILDLQYPLNMDSSVAGVRAVDHKHRG